MANLGNIDDLRDVKLLVCDMQERFRPSISHFDEITSIAQRLVNAAKILEIPMLVTEQYPKGLGSTVPELDIEHAAVVAPKTQFTMLTQEIKDEINFRKQNHFILCGIETHVCIQQTVIDLLKNNQIVHVVADAVSSRSQTDRLMALERFRQMGAFVTTCEAILLQLVGDKDHPKFKEIQQLIKVLPPDTHLFNKL